MILPSEAIKPIDYLFCILIYIIDILKPKPQGVDELHHQLNKVYPIEVSIKTVILCLDFLYIIGMLDLKDDCMYIKQNTA